jgi:hypothetical protein
MCWVLLCVSYLYLALIRLCEVGINSLIFQMRKRRIKEAKMLKVMLLVSKGFSIQIYI